MQLHIVDICIILSYLAATVVIGIVLRRKASKNLDTYFLGGHSVPWYVLGVSNASGMFDITGTMLLVTWCFVYGLKSVWLPWIWPMFNQIFLMVYLATWLRRSNVLTGAEWIRTRFGTGTGANLSHIIIVVFAIISVIGFLAYAFVGIGKFAKIFLPWDLSAHTYALIFIGITSIYVVMGGLLSVVFTEVLQFLIMTVSSVAIAIIAMAKVKPGMIDHLIPSGWKDIFFGAHLNLDWSGIMPAVNDRILADGYELFGVFFGLMMFKGILVSMAGPAPNYDMQRILATRNPREASLMSGFVNIALFFPRYLMVAGLTVLALAFFSSQLNAMGSGVDFELILPYAIRNFIPVGLMGILLAGLLSAFMSTFAATVNAAPAYIVNDIYKRFINPGASPKRLVRMSYAASIAVVIIGIAFGFVIDSINDITLWITSSLWGGYAASNILKWYWWRFNGFGYFWGMVAGILGALVVPVLFPDISSMNSFPIILAIATVGCVGGSLLTKPDTDEILLSFYTTVRPWGIWGPVREKALAADPNFKVNRNFLKDMTNVVIGLIWQAALIATPIYIVIRQKAAMGIGLGVILVCTFLLKKNWYDRLES